jgi:AraC-like DNA-binding protein
MLWSFEDRQPDSPYVERIWRTHSERAGTFISLALSHWQMCVWRHQGKTTVTVRGPETKATPTVVPADAEYLGIVFKLGTFMPRLPVSQLVDAAVNLPDAGPDGFWLDSTAWQFPDYENVDTFVDRLVRDGLLVRETIVDAALQGQLYDISPRSIQRRFAYATGVTHRAIYQIERARYATILLRRGVSILDTVQAAGFADQPHLTRSLKQLMGLTPAQLIASCDSQQLSYLFKTDTVVGTLSEAAPDLWHPLPASAKPVPATAFADGSSG